MAEVAALFPEGDVTAIPLEGGIGAASALKMAFGGWNKIGVALAAQAYAIARAYGVEDALAGEGVESRGIVRGSREGLALGAGDGGGRATPPPRSGFPTAWAARRQSSSGAGRRTATSRPSSSGCSKTSRPRASGSTSRRR